jgi:hypothetical protein
VKKNVKILYRSAEKTRKNAVVACILPRYPVYFSVIGF